MISDTYYKSSKEPGFRKVLRDAVSDGEILECPANVEVCSKIVGSVKPEILITDLGEWESVSTVAIESLIRTCKESGTKLFVDVSNVIELSSQPNANGVFRYLSENGFGPDVSVFGSFVRNAVYKKLSVCFVLSKNEFLLNSLKNAAELTYSRVPVIPQLYYEAIFNDLLAFQLSELKLKEVESFHSPDGHFYQTQLTDHAKRAFDHNSIKSEYRKFDDDSIRLDYGENELGVSISFKRSVFECFAKKNLDVNHNTLKELVRSKLSCEFGISSPGKLLFSLGAAPIYSELCYLAAKDKKKLIFPKGNYGMFHAAATYNGCELIEVDTLEKDGFKLTPGILNDVLKENPGSWVYLQYPVLNPTGQLLDRNELDSLLKVAKVHSAKIIIDTVFGGLVFSEGSQNFDSDVFLLSNKTDNSIDAFVLGGPSKEFAAGGLRVGFVWGNNAELMEKLNSNLSKPHDTSLAVYQDLLNHASKGDSDLITKQEEQRLLLASHAKRLTAVLEEFGWDVLAPRGGLFLMAKEPSHYPKDFNEQLFTKHNVSINSSEWTGIEGYSRFVLSVESAKFEEALKRLKAAFSGYNNK
jgi:methionine S-methyltransferase